MSQIQQLLTEHIDIWTSAETEKKSGRGRASGSAGKVYGIQKLRDLILDLAVRGKLVPQDTNDEPASELLKRIQAEKAKLITEGKLKKEKLLAPISDNEKLFEIPMGWEWVRLGQIGRIFNGNSINENEKLDKFTNRKTGYPFIATKDVGYGRDALEYQNGVLIPFDDNSFKIAHKGAVLICAEGGSAGKKVGITNQDICFGNKLFANEVWTEIEPFYIFHFYQSVAFYSTFQKKMTGIIGGISLNEFISIPVAIPSFKEQRRIVAKVDELMSLCDQLEQQHSTATEAHEKLVEYLLGTLTQVQNAQDFNSQWLRIYSHFDTLFTTEASIDALKQTLLQLAVMGKLVPQELDDEPASELLKRIQVEKAKLITEGKLKKEKPLAPITDDEKPFELPEGWSYVRLRELATHLGDGLHGTPLYSENGEYHFINGNNLKEGKIVIKSETKKIDIHEYEKYKKPLNQNTVLVSINGTLGAVGFYDGEPIILGKSACYINLVSGKISKYFVKLLIDAPTFMKFALENATGMTIKNLGLKAINDLPIALPPLAEQHRIVSKVDELMTLCNQLKARIQQAGQHQRQLADVFVAHSLS